MGYYLLVDAVQPGVLLLNCSALGTFAFGDCLSLFYGSVNFLRFLGSAEWMDWIFVSIIHKKGL